MLTEDGDPRERWGLCSPRERVILTALAKVDRQTLRLLRSSPLWGPILTAELDRRDHEPEWYTTVFVSDGTSFELKVEPIGPGHFRTLIGGRWLALTETQVHRR